MSCLKQTFTWTCGCTTEHIVHHKTHLKSQGDECPKTHDVGIKMMQKYSHIENKGTKKEKKVECTHGAKPAAATGGNWGSVAATADASQFEFGGGGGSAEWGSEATNATTDVESGGSNW